MAKNKLKPQSLNNANETAVVDNSKKTKDKKVKAKKETAPKRSRVKETVGELKKVTWPTFGKTMAQTGMVLSVVVIFTLLILGVDLLLTWLVGLIQG